MTIKISNVKIKFKYLQGREARDREVDTNRKIILGTVHLCNGDGLTIGSEESCKLIPNRGQLLAVTTPSYESFNISANKGLKIFQDIEKT
jgi:hypothetical protein